MDRVKEGLRHTILRQTNKQAETSQKSNFIILFVFYCCRVDFLIPNVQIVGGYSMCSAPFRLQTDKLLELAVKYSDHVPAHWVHKKVKKFKTN